jgi:hypothetical protein
MNNTKHILIQATDTTKHMHTISLDIRLDFNDLLNSDDNFRANFLACGFVNKLRPIISKLTGFSDIECQILSETEYSQMINNGQ